MRGGLSCSSLIFMLVSSCVTVRAVLFFMMLMYNMAVKTTVFFGLTNVESISTTILILESAVGGRGRGRQRLLIPKYFG